MTTQSAAQALAATPALQGWELDKAHSEVAFAVRHLMVSSVKGRFSDFDAVIDLDPAQPERSSVQATIDVAGLTTGNPDRDAHLRSADFFDAGRFPQITFVGRRVVPNGDNTFRLLGDLTIRDITRDVWLEGEFGGPILDLQGKRRLGFSLHGKIDREQFGLTYNALLETGGVAIGKDVKISIEAEVVER